MEIITIEKLKQNSSLLQLSVKKIFTAVLVILAFKNTAKAETETVKNISWNLCQNAIGKLNQENNMPIKLLNALSIADAGRWNRVKQETIAWPWTFSINGWKFFFETKQKAVREVQDLLGEGWRNILVGCLQVNIDKHGSAFFDLNEAFDPRSNAYFAANYIKNIYKKELGWLNAIKEYHPNNFLEDPDYTKKLQHLWSRKEEQQKIYLPSSPQSIDHSRTMSLNQRLRDKRKNAREENTKIGLSNLRKSQIQAWRTNRSRPETLAQVLAVRIAENAKRRQSKLKKLYNQKNKVSFAQKRRTELLNWRKRLAPTPN
jgi:hypothetical protein